jgi:hypothetical protein
MRLHYCSEGQVRVEFKLSYAPFTDLPAFVAARLAAPWRLGVKRGGVLKVAV